MHGDEQVIHTKAQSPRNHQTSSSYFMNYEIFFGEKNFRAGCIHNLHFHFYVCSPWKKRPGRAISKQLTEVNAVPAGTLFF